MENYFENHIGTFIIISIPIAILQIILFFKLWGMTNNVKRLTKEFTNSEPHISCPIVTLLLYMLVA